jgi:hypothetical protein
MAVADVHRNPAAEVRKGEVDPSVAPVIRAEQREQRLVLVDGQQLAVALGPALRREAEAHQAQL